MRRLPAPWRRAFVALRATNFWFVIHGFGRLYNVFLYCQSNHTVHYYSRRKHSSKARKTVQMAGRHIAYAQVPAREAEEHPVQSTLRNREGVHRLGYEMRLVRAGVTAADAVGRGALCRS